MKDRNRITLQNAAKDRREARRQDPRQVPCRGQGEGSALTYPAKDCHPLQTLGFKRTKVLLRSSRRSLDLPAASVSGAADPAAASAILSRFGVILFLFGKAPISRKQLC